jgi:hypothetical protein
MPLWLVVGFHVREPCLEVLALAAGHHLGEGAHVGGFPEAAAVRSDCLLSVFREVVAGQGARVRAPGQNRGELGLLAGIEGGGAG